MYHETNYDRHLFRLDIYHFMLIVHYTPEQKIVSSLCYLVSIKTGHFICRCVYSYDVITLNTRTVRVLQRKGYLESL